MKNKFKITMALKSIFFIIVLLLMYSYKREADLSIVIAIVVVISIGGVLLYFKNVKKYVLTEKIKQLYQLDIKSADFEQAKALVHRGRFAIAQTKFEDVLQANPGQENIKTIIAEIRQYLSETESR